MTYNPHPNLSERIDFLRKRIAQKEKALDNPPEGHLCLRPQNGKTYFEYISVGSPPQRRYLSLKNPEDMALIRALAQRDYDKKVLKCCQDELKILLRLEKQYRDGLPEDIAEKISPARRALIDPISLTDEEYAEIWQAKYQAPNRIRPDDQTFPTERGEIVKSKSEAAIADKLFMMGIPYCYEYPVRVNNHLTRKPYTAHPDFFVLNRRTRKTYVWEHLGSMDRMDYVNDNLRRMIDLEDTGIIQGRNLIISYETKQIPFNSSKAKKIIQTFLL